MDLDEMGEGGGTDCGMKKIVLGPLLFGVTLLGSAGTALDADVLVPTCSCAFNAGFVPLTNCGANFPLQANISVTYSDDAHSGQCEGGSPPCAVLGDCAGTATVTVMTNAFTGLVPFPSSNPPLGTVTEVMDVSYCGDEDGATYALVDTNVLSPNFGLSICIVRFFASCGKC